MPDATISAAGMRVVKILIGNPPQSVADLIRATGVTRTAVMEQLNELVTTGFVERDTERLSGRGRPRHLYKATHAALLLMFTNAQQLIVPAILRAVHDHGGEELTKKIIKRVSRQLGDHYGKKITAKKPEERLRQFINLLTEEGGLIEAMQGDDGRLMIYRRSCPFVSMVDDHYSVCLIDQEMLTAVVGHPVRRVACRHDGAPCCRFALDK
jgi:predicted ArsR family transcriptional regulator